jgi:hypothetical protein
MREGACREEAEGQTRRREQFRHFLVIRGEIMLKLVAFTTLAIALVTAPARAGTAAGKPVLAAAGTSGLFVFEVGAISGRPACATSNQFAIDSNSTTGRVMIATVLSAQAQGRLVTVNGSGACEVWGDRETAAMIWTQ